MWFQVHRFIATRFENATEVWVALKLAHDEMRVLCRVVFGV